MMMKQRNHHHQRRAELNQSRRKKRRKLKQKMRINKFLHFSKYANMNADPNTANAFSTVSSPPPPVIF
jgi:hypothetical protein